MKDSRDRLFRGQAQHGQVAGIPIREGTICTHRDEVRVYPANIRKAKIPPRIWKTLVLYPGDFKSSGKLLDRLGKPVITPNCRLLATA